MKGIVLRAEEVRALLAGATQIRRVIKPPIPETEPLIEVFTWFAPELPPEVKADEGCYYRTKSGLKFHAHSPYEVGQRLYCQEKWGYHGMETCGPKHIARVFYWADEASRKVRFPTFEAMYAATPEQNFKKPNGFDELDEWEQGMTKSDWLNDWWKRAKTKSAVTMKPWASRITLSIVGVRAERLRDMRVKDVRACGFDPQDEGAYETFWDAHEGKRPGCDWAANPFVWCYEIRRESE